MAQKSPIFGIKLACGSRLGYQKLEDGRVVVRTAGPTLDGQEISNSQRHALQEKGASAATWRPSTQSDEWLFE